MQTTSNPRMIMQMTPQFISWYRDICSRTGVEVNIPSSKITLQASGVKRATNKVEAKPLIEEERRKEAIQTALELMKKQKERKKEPYQFNRSFMRCL